MPGHSAFSHWLRAKIRFNMAKVPYLPVRYRLAGDGADLPVWWSRIMPFLNPNRGLWNFELHGWDERELRFVRRYLKPGMTFIDIGAYHGLYSVVAGRAMGRTGRIIAFEPTVKDARRTKLHLRLNGVEGAVVEPFAVSNKTGVATFWVPTSGVRTVASLRASRLARAPLRETTVPTITLDEYCARRHVDSIDIVKVDVEGAELELLEGAATVLNHHRPIWIIEAIDDVTHAWGYRARDILLALREHEYALFGFTETGAVVPHDIAEHYPLQTNSNYLAVPVEHVSAFAEQYGH